MNDLESGLHKPLKMNASSAKQYVEVGWQGEDNKQSQWWSQFEAALVFIKSHPYGSIAAFLVFLFIFGSYLTLIKWLVGAVFGLIWIILRAVLYALSAIFFKIYHFFRPAVPTITKLTDK